MSWYLHPLVHLSWKSWSDEWVVYDDASGQTYLLDGLGAFILNELDAGPLNTQAMIVTLSNDLSLCDRGNLEEQVVATLAQLTTTGLVENAPS